jgi:endonuclease/exonuclease/phosphatase family metal-dependent hydrolase
MSPATFTLLAFNVLYNAGTEHVAASIEAIEKNDADIVCLTELTPKFAARFKARLGKKYPHRSFSAKSGTWGVGIASRHALEETQEFQQKPHRIPAMEAKVMLPGGPVVVACLHLFPPLGVHNKNDGIYETMEKNQELRKKQAEFLVARYHKRTIPVLLVGDMNESPGDDALKTFARGGYTRSCERAPEADCGATWPGATSYFPAAWEIDHIFGTRVNFLGARVVREGGSDHYPVWAKVSRN